MLVIVGMGWDVCDVWMCVEDLNIEGLTRAA